MLHDKRLALHRSMLLCFSDAENTAHQLGYHLLFVVANDAHRNPAGGCGITPSFDRVSRFT